MSKKKILRLTESDLNNVIVNTVKSIIREMNEGNTVLSEIAKAISFSNDIDAQPGENEINLPLDENEDDVAYINFFVYDKRYKVPGMRGVDRDVPDDDDIIKGDFDVEVNEIMIYTSDDERIPVKDNGMVASALKSNIVLNNEDLEYYR